MGCAEAAKLAADGIVLDVLDGPRARTCKFNSKSYSLADVWSWESAHDGGEAILFILNRHELYKSTTLQLFKCTTYMQRPAIP